jgi:probable rRNA maturation factor
MHGPLILNRQRKHSISLAGLRQFTTQLSRHLGIPESEFAIVFSNDRTIRRLNRKFRNKDKVTDVLSFAEESGSKENLNFEGKYLGDIIISVETAQRQAFDKNHSLETELRILIIHGLLHLLGNDHETDGGQMRRKELRLRQKLLTKPEESGRGRFNLKKRFEASTFVSAELG